MPTLPAASAIWARAFGLRASKISTMRGRPCVMSWPATPPVWNVRMVSCVPGSPIDWAAMMPTASPMSTVGPDAVTGATHAGAGVALERRADRDLGLVVLERLGDRFDVRQGDLLVAFEQ